MSDDNDLRPDDVQRDSSQRDEGARSDDQTVSEQSEPLPLSDDMGDPRFDVAGVALGAVSSEEAAEVRAAAAADATIAAELAALREVVAELARLAPLQTINRGRSAGIRSRLIARASASRAGRPPARPSSPVFGSGGSAAGTEQASMSSGAQRGAGSLKLGTTHTGASHQKSGAASTNQGGRTEQKHDPQHAPVTTSVHTSQQEPRHLPRAASGSGGRPWGWLALAASIAFVAAATQLWRVSNERADVTGALASRQTALAEKVSQLEASVATRDSVIAALTGTSTRVIDLASYSSLTPVARMFWDQKTAQWTMYATHLKSPPAGKTYQLWLIAKGNPTPISAGTFAPDVAGSAVMHAKYDMPPGSLQRIAVTEEPAGGVAAPTGPVVLAGVGK